MREKRKKISIYETDNGVEFSFNFESESQFRKALKFLNKKLDLTSFERGNSFDQECSFAMSLAEYHEFKAHMDGA